MGGNGGFPIDLVLFGMIAAFLVLRLRSILGKRTGFERSSPPPGLRPDMRSRGEGRPTSPPLGPTIEGRAEPGAAPARPLPDPASPAGQGLARIIARDRNFDPARFLAGAESAFRLIVTAYAAGNREQLRPLLTDETFAAFDAAIRAREAAGETQHTEIRSIHSVAIEAAGVNGDRAEITLRFVSDQVSLTRDRSGQPVAGTDAVTEITDIWTFERDLSHPSDPAWRLAAAHSG